MDEPGSVAIQNRHGRMLGMIMIEEDVLVSVSIQNTQCQFSDDAISLYHFFDS